CNFDGIVKNYFEKIYANQLQIRTLSRLRDTLLPKLMSRELKVQA
ncbi:MAG TPA: restriction endonuclease subunit S, partial [Nitrospiraceae bacterium]|nr:restriction endonuclease subunit S [Nitrospiraceae bacterium]